MTTLQESFCKKPESLQYQACLAITEAINGTSRNTINEELGFKSLKGTVMQIEKAPINDCLRFQKHPQKFYILFIILQ